MQNFKAPVPMISIKSIDKKGIIVLASSEPLYVPEDVNALRNGFEQDR